MNDERPIEKLLRRAAKKRSAEAGPPPELHPANRRALQGEVARQFPKSGAAKQSALAEFWAGLTQRWVYAVGLFVVLGVAAIVILPAVSKSKGKTNLALNKPSEDRREMELAKNAVAAPESLAVPAVAMELDSSSTTLGFSGGGNVGNFSERASAAPLVTAPAALADREISGRRDIKDASLTLGETMVASGTIQPVTRAEGQARLAGETTETFSRSTPASVAQRAPPTRSIAGNEFRGGNGGGNVAAIAADPGLKIEEQMVTNGFGTGLKNFDSLSTSTGAKSASAPAGAATDGFADKTWLARGGGQERERTVLNSQAYANVGAEDLLARKKEARFFKEPLPVLTNFKIEQAGRDLRVVDGDGSVYNGVVDEENTLYKQVVDRQNQMLSNSYENKFKFQSPKLADAQTALKQSEANYYLYRVEGTNRSLNQNVVFTWNFIDTNALATANQTYNNAAQKLDATKLPSQFPALLQNSFINGRAQFSEGREIEVNAVPVKP